MEWTEKGCVFVFSAHNQRIDSSTYFILLCVKMNKGYEKQWINIPVYHAECVRYAAYNTTNHSSEAFLE